MHFVNKHNNSSGIEYYEGDESVTFKDPMLELAYHEAGLLGIIAYYITKYTSSTK